MKQNLGIKKPDLPYLLGSKSIEIHKVSLFSIFYGCNKYIQMVFRRASDFSYNIESISVNFLKKIPSLNGY